MTKVLELFTRYKPLFFNGTLNTLKISIVATIFGLIIGLITGTIRTLPKKNGFGGFLQKVVNLLISAYITLFRGTPMMVQASLLFYGFPLFLGVDVDKILTAYIIVSVNTGAYMSEVVRGGIISIDKGQWEALRASGLSHIQTMLYVIGPQTLRNILPATGNEFVINIKDTSVLNVIGVGELFFAAKTVAGQSYSYFETYFIILIIYLLLTTVITEILRQIEKRLEGPVSFELKMGNQQQV